MSSTTNAPTNVSWAAGARDESGPATVVAAVQPQSGGATYNQLTIQIPRTSSGSETIDVDCQADNCAAVIVILGSNDANDSFQFFCGLESGTVAITSISATRASGTFSGSGTCFTGGFADGGSFAISNGSFDVPLVSNVPQ